MDMMEKIRRNTKITKGGCWEWIASTNSAGYGQITINHKYWLSHRYVYTVVHGPITDDLVIRHKCHNRKCCNPDHLIEGTGSQNWWDSEELHRSNAAQRRKVWIIDNKKYDTLDQAAELTGLSVKTIIKYTDNGVFDVAKYRKQSFMSGREPKV